MTTQISLIYGQSDIHFFMDFRAKQDIKKNGLANYEVIYTTEVAESEIKSVQQIAERFFMMTNSPYEKNPLSEPEMQQKIKKSKAHHTSMSIGDIVGIKPQGQRERYFLCCDEGFEEVEIPKVIVT